MNGVQVDDLFEILAIGTGASTTQGGEGSQGEGSQGEGSQGEGSQGEGSQGEGSQGEGSQGEGSQGEGGNSPGEGEGPTRRLDHVARRRLTDSCAVKYRIRVASTALESSLELAVREKFKTSDIFTVKFKAEMNANSVFSINVGSVTSTTNTKSNCVVETGGSNAYCAAAYTDAPACATASTQTPSTCTVKAGGSNPSCQSANADYATCMLANPADASTCSVKSGNN